jgi:Lon-like protease
VNRTRWNGIVAGVLALLFGGLGATLPIPMVALGPGPTYDTLDAVGGVPVVAITGLPTYPTSGHLNMTTVAVTDQLTLFSALAYWASDGRQVVPRSTIYSPEKSDAQVQAENTEQFAASESNAEVAALNQLKLPTRVVVGEFTDGSPAAATLKVGDEIDTVAGKAVDSPSAVADALVDTKPGQTVQVGYARDGQPGTADVVLGASPDRPQGLLGVRPGIEPRNGDITISLGDIGGPSAGLMFALSVVDKLTPGEITGGRFVAGTGTITQDGQVGPIGGIPFKMAAAKTAGATVFLVPADNCTEARSTAPSGLELVRVGTLADAVAGLDALRAGAPVTGC